MLSGSGNFLCACKVLDGGGGGQRSLLRVVALRSFLVRVGGSRGRDSGRLGCAKGTARKDSRWSSDLEYSEEETRWSSYVGYSEEKS